MNTLSLHQPWASLIALGEKRIETRSWPYLKALPTVLAIHATAGMTELVRLELFSAAGRPLREALARHGVPLPALPGRTASLPLPSGAVVALARLVECVGVRNLLHADDPESPGKIGRRRLEEYPPEVHFGDYRTGRWGWVFDQVLALPEPIPARGQRRLWQWTAPEPLNRWALEQLGILVEGK
jgi:hypothetical protein